MTAPANQTCRVLVTAGPTHEPIDAVRYVANRSSGRMGVAIAMESARRRLPTTLLLGPTRLDRIRTLEDSQIATLRFRTTADLEATLARAWPTHDVLIMAAAVADYRPAVSREDGKIRRDERPLVLELEPTPDLVAGLRDTTRDDQLVIGFALEAAADLETIARSKLERKGLDAIVANPLETMDAEAVSATLILADGTTLAAPEGLPKDDFAAWLLDRLGEIARASGKHVRGL